MGNPGSVLREAIREVTESQPPSNYTMSGTGTTYLLLVVHIHAGNGLPPDTWLGEILRMPLAMIYCRFNSVISLAGQTFIRRD